MRELKFRAWDKEEKELLTGDDNQGSVFGEEGGYFDLRVEGDEDRYEIMQYTGLKDKNGKEIYQGDICKFYHHPNDVVVISYDEDLLSNKATVVSEGIYCEDYYFIKTDSHKYEVIGNIHQNPELLK